MSTNRRANQRTLSLLAVLVVAMVGLSYAAVPLYDLFCKVTGFGGTPQRADATNLTGLRSVNDTAASQLITVRFNADTHPTLPWSFVAGQTNTSVQVGVQTLMNYHAQNISETPTTGTANFNVTPATAGQYFVKIECFCFTEQTLAPGEKVDMPVQFFIDPAILEDPYLNTLTTMTLSYTFFPTEQEQR